MIRYQDILAKRRARRRSSLRPECPAHSAQMPQTIAPASATPVPGPMPEVLQKYTPVTAERLRKPEDGNWFHFRRTYDGWGYSPLKRDHARQRAPAAAGLDHGHRTGRGSPGAADRQQRRDVRRHPRQSVARDRGQDRQAACGATSGRCPKTSFTLHPTNRGVALYGDKVYFASADCVLVALDAKTGKEVWTAKVDDYKKAYYMSLAPLIVDGKVILGASGGELGVRGFVAAIDAETGKELWKTYTVPAPGEPGQRNLAGGRRSLQARRRCNLGDRHVRSGDQSHLLGNRQCRPVVRRSAAWRQSLHDLGGRARRQRPARSRATSSITPTIPGTGTRSRRRSSSTTSATAGP